MRPHLFDANDFGMLILSLSVAFGLIVFAFASLLIICAAVVFYPITLSVAVSAWILERARENWKRVCK